MVMTVPPLPSPPLAPPSPRRPTTGAYLASQLTPHPQPLPLACGFSRTRNALPMSSVVKSTVAPLSIAIEAGSMTIGSGRSEGGSEDGGLSVLDGEGERRAGSVSIVGHGAQVTHREVITPPLPGSEAQDRKVREGGTH